MQNIIVGIIGLLVLFFVIRAVVKAVRAKGDTGCGCGCGGCGAPSVHRTTKNKDKA